MIVVMITGTNCVGKTTLVKAIIEKCGGIKNVIDRSITILNGGNYALIGRYNSGKYGGVDSLNCTKVLKDLVVKAKDKGVQVLFMEGSYLHTFGLNLTNALFSAEKQLIVNLYAKQNVIVNRLKERSNKQGVQIDKVLQKQLCTMRSAQKYRDTVLKVLQFDTGSNSVDVIKEKVLETLNRI